MRGFGLGCWLLPEGYMWGIRKLDRPRQFESAIVDLIGKQDAEEFWRLYRDNFLIEEDIAAMKSWGVNSVRIALLASMLQPREGQPDSPPYIYSDDGFHYLDKVVEWCEKYEVGLIWDMHGAPGAQNAENIADSDGEARLWTEPEKYWPRANELWLKIAERYKDKKCIIGYDLLNEPLLRRYEGIDGSLLREFYIQVTEVIRTVDSEGIIFIEGDDWAQNFTPLEPLDWDPNLVIAFHSYPPTSSQNGLQRWDDLRRKYNIPLWHGETGEQGPPYTKNLRSTHFLESANVGWSWWTHKKFNRMTQPWTIYPPEGFTKILDYWKGEGQKPSREDARKWLFEMAVNTHTASCEFLPDLVSSLYPLDPTGTLKTMDTKPPRIITHPTDTEIMYGNPAVFQVRASGYPLHYQWYLDDEMLEGENGFQLIVPMPDLQMNDSYVQVEVMNAKGNILSQKARMNITEFSGSQVPYSKNPVDSYGSSTEPHELQNYLFGSELPADDLSAWFKITWNETGLYLFVNVNDDVLIDSAQIDYERDGVEIYIDADNSKSFDYGPDEFLIRYNWNDPILYTSIGELYGKCVGSQTTTKTGYRMQVEIPWKVIKGKPGADQFIGIDIHINDNDGSRRDAKLTWKAVRDNSYQSPSYFGTMRLVK